MSANGKSRFIPEHAVPVTINELLHSKTEKIRFGTSELVRVHTMGRIIDQKHEDCEVEYEIFDELSEDVLKITKLLTSSFTKEHSQVLENGDFADVFGKVRVSSDGSVFLNAFMIRVTTREEYRAFLSTCQLAEKFYASRSSNLPMGCGTRFTNSYGLKNKAGSLNRFPIGMLEESSSFDNNMGDWPADLEQLAAGISTNKLAEMNRVNDGSEKEKEKNMVVAATGEGGEEEEDDSFDAGPPQKRRRSQDASA